MKTLVYEGYEIILENRVTKRYEYLVNDNGEINYKSKNYIDEFDNWFVKIYHGGETVYDTYDDFDSDPDPENLVEQAKEVIDRLVISNHG